MAPSRASLPACSRAQATRFGVYMYIPADYRKTPLGSACSGAFAGGFSVIIFQGLDVIKSRMQGLDAAKYTSSIHCLKELIANEGIMALYKGVGPRMTRVCCEVCTHSAPTPRPLRARSAPALRPPCAHSAPPLHPLFTHPPRLLSSHRTFCSRRIAAPALPAAPSALPAPVVRFTISTPTANLRNLCRWRSQ